MWRERAHAKRSSAESVTGSHLDSAGSNDYLLSILRTNVLLIVGFVMKRLLHTSEDAENARLTIR